MISIDKRPKTDSSFIRVVNHDYITMVGKRHKRVGLPSVVNIDTPPLASPELVIHQRIRWDINMDLPLLGNTYQLWVDFYHEQFSWPLMTITEHTNTLKSYKKHIQTYKHSMFTSLLQHILWLWWHEGESPSSSTSCLSLRLSPPVAGVERTQLPALAWHDPSRGDQVACIECAVCEGSV